MVWSPCSPRDSRKSSPTPEFRNINSLALSFLYNPTLISIHDYWKKHSFDWMDLCQWIMSLLFILIFIFILFYFFDLGIVIFLIVAFVLVSAVQQSESAHIYIYPLFFGFPFHLGHMLSRSVIAFLPKSKRLLISCLQSTSAVILSPEK